MHISLIEPNKERGIPLPIEDQLPVQVSTVPFKAPNVLIYYPIIQGLQNQRAQHKINNSILTNVQQLIKKQDYYEHPRETEVSGYYELKNNQRRILSLTLSNFAYTQHAAHGMTYLKGLTFDVNSGKSYTLKDLFKPGSPYVKTLSDIIALQIKRRDITLLDKFTGIKPDQDFYIADKCLVVFFQLYEITAYVYGFPMFPISVYELQDIINEDGPLGKMIPGN